MTLGYRRNLYMLAFDHRASFSKNLLGFTGELTPEQVQRVSDTKTVIFEGFLDARDKGAPPDESGILVDEQFGAEIARQARSQGILLAMPVERSGQEEFDFEFGEEFGAHIEHFDPTFAKVLVRYNPEGDAELNARQAKRLQRLSAWLLERDRKFLFELLVPATASQLASVEAEPDLYDLEIRPGLMVRAIAELQQAGVEADIWKIEGIDRREDCERIAAQARSGGRDEVACIVLGRGASEEKVDHWLRVGAATPGFRGFAIGRTMWWDALVAYRDGSAGRTDAARQIAQRYLRAIKVYREAEAAARGSSPQPA
jgi:myo-inositol catabolism protein IolC